MMQEDHNHYDTDSAKVWAYDRETGPLTFIARTDPTRGAVTRAGGNGVWESSGIVDVSEYFGRGYWQGLDLVVGLRRRRGWPADPPVRPGT